MLALWCFYSSLCIYFLSSLYCTHRAVTVICCPMHYFCSQTSVILYSAWNYYDGLIFLTQYLHSFMASSFFLHYYLRPSCKLHRIVTVFIRTLFQFSCITQTMIAVRHYPAIFIVCRGVSLHISASESISGYGCRVFRVACTKLADFSEVLSVSR